jgi:hypothetical protein
MLVFARCLARESVVFSALVRNFTKIKLDEIEGAQIRKILNVKNTPLIKLELCIVLFTWAYTFLRMV